MKKFSPEQSASFIYGVVTTVLLVALMIFFVLSFSLYILPPSVEIEPREFQVRHVLCPGSTVVRFTRMTIRRPSVIEVDGALYDARTRRVVAGSEYSGPARPRHVGNESVLIPIEFTVPDLRPGVYQYVIAMTPKNQSAETTFLIMTFRVAEGCAPNDGWTYVK